MISVQIAKKKNDKPSGCIIQVADMEINELKVWKCIREDDKRDEKEVIEDGEEAVRAKVLSRTEEFGYISKSGILLRFLKVITIT